MPLLLRSRWGSALAGAVAVLALAACSGSAGNGTPASSPPLVPSTAPPPSSSAAPTTSKPSSSPSETPKSQRAVTLAQAVGIAEKEVDGAAINAELSNSGEQQVWEVDVRRSKTRTVEVVVAATGGRIVRKTNDDTDDEARAGAPDFKAVDAMKAAEKRVDGGQATSIELDVEGGNRIWDVKVRQAGAVPVDVSYDADSGRFLRQRSGD